MAKAQIQDIAELKGQKETLRGLTPRGERPKSDGLR